jgi:hypothetical protein
LTTNLDDTALTKQAKIKQGIEKPCYLQNNLSCRLPHCQNQTWVSSGALIQQLLDVNTRNMAKRFIKMAENAQGINQ